MIDYIILSVLVCGLCIAVYLIAQFSTKETPFEQAVAEQRQKWDNENGRTKLDRVHKKPKIKKITKTKKDESKLQPKPQLVPMYDLMKSSDDSSSNSDKKGNVNQNATGTELDNGTITVLEGKKKGTVQPAKVAREPVLSTKSSAPTEVSKSSKHATLHIKEVQEHIVPQKEQVKVAENPKVDVAKTVVEPKIVKEEVIIVKELSKAKQSSNKLQKEVKKPAKEVEQVKEKKSLKRHHDEIETMEDELDVDPELLNSGSHLMRYYDMEQRFGGNDDAQHNKNVAAAERRKKKDKDTRKRGTSVNEESLECLVSMVQKSPLSNGEIQSLIDALLNKQSIGGDQVGAEWVETGKQDPMTVMRKQLEDAETKTKELTTDHKALMAKIAELRVEINSERSKNIVLKKEVSSISTKMQAKFDVADANHKANLSFKVKEVQSLIEKDFEQKFQQEKQALLATAEQKVAQLEAALTDAELQKQNLQSSIHDTENQTQHSRAIILEAEQQQQTLQTALAETQQQLQGTIQTRDELTQMCQQYTQHIGSLKEQQANHDASLGVQLSETQSQLAEMQRNYSLLQSSKEQTLHQLSQVLADNENVKLQVKNLENSRELLNQTKVQLMETLREKSEVESRLGQLDSELKGAKEIVKKQSSEIDCLRSENAALASESIRPAAEGQENGDVNHIEKDSFVVVEHSNEIHEEKISNLNTDIIKLKEELSQQQKKNDFDVEKLVAESQMTKDILLRIFPGIERKEWDQRAFLEEIEAQAAKFSVEHKPQIVERIVEKIVSDPALEVHIEKLKVENAALLQKVSSLEEAQTAQTAPLPVEVVEDTSVDELKLENKNLAEKLRHYQEVLGTTEALLKSIQASVENEEVVWSAQLKEKEKQLESVNKDKDSLNERITDLEDSLKQSQSSTEVESELESLKEKLAKDEEEKRVLKEDLVKAQKQLRSLGDINEVASSNGPSNGLECHEDTISQTDSESIFSASSSISEGLASHLTHSNVVGQEKDKKKEKEKENRSDCPICRMRKL